MTQGPVSDESALKILDDLNYMMDDGLDYATARSLIQVLASAFSDLISERDTGYRFLEAWQNWNRQMHHELNIGDLRVLPDDTKGRLELADRLRAGVVAAEAAARLRAERNQLAYECSLLAEAWILVAPLVANWSSRPARLAPINALAERHYRKGELEPNGDTVPHPYRMTPELAAALSGLSVAEDPDPEHQADCHASTLPESYLRLSKAIERVTNALRDQQPDIG